MVIAFQTFNYIMDNYRVYATQVTVNKINNKNYWFCTQKNYSSKSERLITNVFIIKFYINNNIIVLQHNNSFYWFLHHNITCL